jgi:hypothetical protein
MAMMEGSVSFGFSLGSFNSLQGSFFGFSLGSPNLLKAEVHRHSITPRVQGYREIPKTVSLTQQQFKTYGCPKKWPCAQARKSSASQSWTVPLSPALLRGFFTSRTGLPMRAIAAKLPRIRPCQRSSVSQDHCADVQRRSPERSGRWRWSSSTSSRRRRPSRRRRLDSAVPQVNPRRSPPRHGCNRQDDSDSPHRSREVGELLPRFRLRHTTPRRASRASWRGKSSVRVRASVLMRQRP